MSCACVAAQLALPLRPLLLVLLLVGAAPGQGASTLPSTPSPPSSNPAPVEDEGEVSVLLWFPPVVALEVPAEADLPVWQEVLEGRILETTGLPKSAVRATTSFPASIFVNVTLRDVSSRLLVEKTADLGELCVTFRRFSGCAATAPPEPQAASCGSSRTQLFLVAAAAVAAMLLAFGACWYYDRRRAHRAQAAAPVAGARASGSGGSGKQAFQKVPSRSQLRDRQLLPMYEPLQSRVPMALRLYESAEHSGGQDGGSLPNSLPRLRRSASVSATMSLQRRVLDRSSLNLPDDSTLNFSDISDCSPHSTLDRYAVSMEPVDMEPETRLLEKDLARRRMTYKKEFVPSGANLGGLGAASSAPSSRPGSGVFRRSVDPEGDRQQLLDDSTSASTAEDGAGLELDFGAQAFTRLVRSHSPHQAHPHGDPHQAPDFLTAVASAPGSKTSTAGSLTELRHSRVAFGPFDEDEVPDSPLPQVPAYGFGPVLHLAVDPTDTDVDSDGGASGGAHGYGAGEDGATEAAGEAPGRRQEQPEGPNHYDDVEKVVPTPDEPLPPLPARAYSQKRSSGGGGGGGGGGGARAADSPTGAGAGAGGEAAQTRKPPRPVPRKPRAGSKHSGRRQAARKDETES